MDLAIFNLDRKASVDGMEHRFRVPGIGLFRLIAFRIQTLTEVTLAVRQSHGNDG